ncbi:arylesterase [Neptunicella marina]|uniref:Arylesterase n=1 Tax=Neptunicella marina TaxID=2125989 RepID=A0A8J6IXN2_9ALTE|nr:arylesterase [Neptunicella marina]MBC3767261.1 arylesterase [Neptunicella marina]
MRSKALMMCLSFCLFFSFSLQAQQQKLLVLGDSLSAGYGVTQEQAWVTLLQNAWKSDNIQVVNAAISGDTTAGGLARLPALLKQEKPSHLLLELGGNDGLQGYPVAEMKSNLASMIELARTQNVKVILQQMQIPTNYGKRYTQMFMAVYPELAEQYDVPLLPFLLQEVALNPDLMQKDGIHPNAKAQPMILKFMQTHLKPLLSQ